MKYLLLVLLLICKLTDAQVNKNVEFSGTIDSGANKQLYLIERGGATSNINNYLILDSTIIGQDGKFFLKTKIVEAKYLSIIGKEMGWFSLLAEPQNEYLVKGNYKELWKAKEQNSLTNKYISELENRLRPYKKLNNQIVDSIGYYKKDTAKFNFFKEKNNDNRKDILEEQVKFIKKYRLNIAALFIYNGIFPMLDAIQKKELFQLLPQKSKKHSVAIKIRTELYETPRSFFDYKLLKSLKNITSQNGLKTDTNFVLISFWATWCSPCIKNFPKIDSLFSTRKDIEMISISFDQSEKFPSAYFQQHGYQWRSFWDEKRSSGDIGILYSIDFLPQYFLCDKTGRIILRTNDFEKILLKVN